MRVPAKKYNEPQVSTFRIVFRAGKWAMKSTRYWSVQCSTDAFHDLYYVFKTGRVHANKITIHRIEKYNIYSHKWVDQTDVVKQHIYSDPEQYDLATIAEKKIYLKQKS